MDPNNRQEEDNNSPSILEEKRPELSPKAEELRTCTVEGKWERVMYLYETDIELCRVEINRSRGTALHVAVNDGDVEVVKSLVGSVMKYRLQEALELTNERGDTPLHLAAARGFKEICECIIGQNGERKRLITIDNEEGETPLFYAALSWQKQTFEYLSSLKPHEEVNYYRDLIRNNGDSILHCAIRREFFDLALIILKKYPDLHDIQNKDRFSPLKLLATRPAAFWSGSKLKWWKTILYHCIPVGDLNVDEAILEATNKESKADEAEQHNYPKNYDTCCLFLMELPYRLKRFINVACGRGDHESENVEVKQHEIPMPEGSSFVPQNYATCLFSMKFAFLYILGLSGAGVEDIRKKKQKHKWSGQLLSELMMKPSESYLGSGAQAVALHQDESYQGVFDGEYIKSAFNKEARNDKVEMVNERRPSAVQETDLHEQKNALLDTKNGIVEMVNELISKMRSAIQEIDLHEPKNALLESKKTSISEAQKMETAILTAARNGIVEMVEEIISKVPSAIHETDMEQKNVLLVAIENRQTLVVEALRKRFDQDRKSKLVFDNLILSVDKNENTVLHMAAATRSEKDWHISGATLRMMWNIRWFQYIKTLVPEHYTIRTNQKHKTAGEIFEDSHIHKELVKNGNEWRHHSLVQQWQDSLLVFPLPQPALSLVATTVTQVNLHWRESQLLMHLPWPH